MKKEAADELVGGERHDLLPVDTVAAIVLVAEGKRGRALNVRVDGQLVFNTSNLMLKDALEGHGLVYLTEGQVAPYLADGRLIRVLADWCEPFAGYHLYYPSRSQPTPAFALLVEALRYRR